MFDQPIKVSRFLQGYGESLVTDIADEDLCRQPVEGMNHPAWILGHLAFAADRHASLIGAERKLADWQDTFGMGSTPTTNRADYPSKAELLTAWAEANARFITAAESADPTVLEKPTQGPLAASLPTQADFITFSMTGHTAIHLGQLSAWRRAMGLGAMF